MERRYVGAEPQIVRFIKPAPEPNVTDLPRFLHGGPHGCSWPTCTRKPRLGGLCPEHWTLALRSANRDVAGAGLELLQISVNVGGYLTTMGPDQRQRSVHSLVMEVLLGRKLLAGENVHHRNGHRADNRPSNLELWVSTQPSGQRPEDLVAYAKTILERYGS